MTDAYRSITALELVRRAAFRLGDLVQITGTDGSTTSVVDVVNLSPGNEDMQRRQIVSSTGATLGSVAVITGHVQATSTLTFNPAMSGTPTACIIINKRGTGFNWNEYLLAATMAQDDAYPIARVIVEGTAAVFDYDTPTISIPSTIDDVIEVLYQDDDGDWWPIGRAGQTSFQGWQANRYDNQIVINGDPRSRMDGLSVKIIGEGKPSALTAHSSTTSLHPDWLVSRMCYHLCLMGMDRDATGLRRSQVTQFDREAMQKTALIRTMRSAHSSSTRSS